jgi:hypothetical protein
MGAAADRLWTCGQRKRVAHRVHSSQQQTQTIATASIRSKETRIPPAVRSHAVPNCQRNAHRFFRGGYKEGGLGPADPLPSAATTPDRAQSDSEVVLSMMLSAVIALAARAAVTKKELDRWERGAANAGLSDIVAPWLAFVTSLFIDNTASLSASGIGVETSQSFFMGRRV